MYPRWGRLGRFMCRTLVTDTLGSPCPALTRACAVKGAWPRRESCGDLSGRALVQDLEESGMLCHRQYSDRTLRFEQVKKCLQ